MRHETGMKCSARGPGNESLGGHLESKTTGMEKWRKGGGRENRKK